MLRMRTHAVCILLVLLGTSLAWPASLQKLALHYAVKADPAPVLDGKLDDPCWKLAPPFTNYVRIYGDNYQDISLQAAWDDAGLYLAIVNSEQHLERLKVNVRTRDGGMVWDDDSAEIYLDPTATAASLFKFDVNSIGVIADYWQVDVGFTDYTWNASSARAATGRTPDAWTIEFFVSWADIKKTPQAGDIWMLTHQRFSYTSGNGSRTAMSTNGGSFYNRRFGYLYFADEALPPPPEVGAKLLKLAVQPWVMPLNGDWLYGQNSQLGSLSTEALLLRFQGQAQQALNTVAEALKTAPDARSQQQFDALNKRFDDACAAAQGGDIFPSMQEFHKITGEAENLRDEVLLAELLK